MNHNRFGFSTKKADNHRPVAQSAYVNRISSIGQNRKPNPEFTPSNQLFALGKETASLRKLSTGKKFSYAASNGIPSTAKSARAMPVSSMGFVSGHKSSVNSKLFGVTPQHSRASYMQQNAMSTSRLSRGSMAGRGGKDNRPLSDQAFHRDCQAKILEFLNENDYPQQITKQNLVRPSMSDVSRIFEFLFSYFHPDIIIKNGANTSIDIIVPKILSELGYPYQLKRSDLVSFSGGRQLGAILEAICFVIDVISYCNIVDATRFNKLFDQEEFTNSVNNQLTTIALENVENQELDDATNDKLKALAESFYGTPQQIEQLEKEEKSLEQNLTKLDEGIAKNDQLPNEIQAYKDENKSYDEYLVEVAEKESDHQKFKQKLLEDIENKEAVLQKVLAEQSRLDSFVGSQKEIIMEYRLSIERKNQIHEEMEIAKQQIQALNEQILASTLEVNKQKAQNSSFIDDLEDVITSFFNTIKSSKLNQISPEFAKTFEEDKEWKKINAELKHYRDWNIDTPSDDLVREVKDFGQRFQNKFIDFKHRLLQQLSSLSGSASIELICKKQELQTMLEKKRQHLAESDAELKRFITEKETLEKDEAAQLDQLNAEIDSARKQIIEYEKETAALEKQMHQMEEKAAELEKAVQNKKRQFAKQMSERVNQDKKHLKSVVKQKEMLVQVTKKSIAEKENILRMKKAYQI